MLTGRRTLLRPLRSADAARQHLFDQDMELSVLDCRQPVPARRERADAFVEQRDEDQRDVARLAIEVDQLYIGVTAHFLVCVIRMAILSSGF